MNTEETIQKLETAIKTRGFLVKRTEINSIAYKFGLVLVVFIHPPAEGNEDKEISLREEITVRDTTSRIADDMGLKAVFNGPGYMRTEYNLYCDHCDHTYPMFCGFESKNRSRIARGGDEGRRAIEEELIFLSVK